MTATYARVRPADVMPGDTVTGAHGPAGRVLEVREPSHALAAAHGAVVLELARERTLAADRERFGTVIRWTVTAFPDTPLYRAPASAAGELPPNVA